MSQRGKEFFEAWTRRALRNPQVQQQALADIERTLLAEAEASGIGRAEIESETGDLATALHHRFVAELDRAAETGRAP